MGEQSLSHHLLERNEQLPHRLRPKPTRAEIQNLIDTINETFGTWWHHLDSTWIVKSDLTCKQIRDLLKPHIDTNDELLVVKLTNEAAWAGFNTKGSQWLLDNL